MGSGGSLSPRATLQDRLSARVGHPSQGRGTSLVLLLGFRLALRVAAVHLHRLDHVLLAHGFGQERHIRAHLQAGQGVDGLHLLHHLALLGLGAGHAGDAHVLVHPERLVGAVHGDDDGVLGGIDLLDRALHLAGFGRRDGDEQDTDGRREDRDDVQLRKRLSHHLVNSPG